MSKLGAYRPDFSLIKYDLVVFFIEKMIMFNTDLWFILFYFILFPSTRCICVSSNTTLNSCYFNIQLYIEQMVKIFLKRHSTIILKLRVSLFWIQRQGNIYFNDIYFLCNKIWFRFICSKFMKCYEAYEYVYKIYYRQKTNWYHVNRKRGDWY